MMKNTTTYGMKNVEVKLEGNIWTVYADTERFGHHEIMAQCISRKEAEKWCKDNGVELESKTAEQLFEEEMSKGGSGKIQIGNAMFRRLRKENGRYIAFGGFGTCGSKYDEDITDVILNCKMIAEGIGRSKFRGGNKTVKFGNACTW